MKRATLLWLAAAIVSLAVCGASLRRDRMEPAAHRTYQEQLRQARHLDLEFNEIVLKIRLGQLPSTDPIPVKLSALRAAHAGLARPPAFLSAEARTALASLQTEIESISARKAGLLQDLRSQNAALADALTALPTLIATITENTAAKPEGRALTDFLARLIREAFAYHFTTLQADEARFGAAIEALSRDLEKYSAVGDRTDLHRVLALAGTALDREPTIAATMRSIASLPSQALYEKMQARYDEEYNAALGRQRTTRSAIVVGVAALLATVFTLLLRQLSRSAGALRIALEHHHDSLAAASDAETRYHDLVERAVEGIFRTTPDGHYLAVNPALTRIYGYATPDDLIRAVTNIGGQLYFDPARRAAFLSAMNATGEVSGFESQIRRRDGSLAWISESAHTVRDEQGATLCYEGTVLDITEQKRAEYDRERRTQRELLHKHCLLELAQFDKTDGDKALRELLDTTSYTLGVARVSAWRATGAGTPDEAISLIDLFDYAKKSHVTDPIILKAAVFPRYFAALREETHIVAHDAAADPRTSEFTGTYLRPLGITAMIDVPIWALGELAGVLCLEHVGGPRTWEEDEVAFAAAVGNLIAVTFETAERRRAEQECAKERARADQLQQTLDAATRPPAH